MATDNIVDVDEGLITEREKEAFGRLRQLALIMAAGASFLEEDEVFSDKRSTWCDSVADMYDAAEEVMQIWYRTYGDGEPPERSVRTRGVHRANWDWHK
tara:strand:+ start:895 stop:1191 length:297 start_codon:yes stop_codon:yes gene_type:complete